jgi:hypothetical protein
MRGGSVSQRRRSAGEEGDIIRNLRKEGGAAVPKTTSISSEIDSQELKTLRATDDLISNPRARSVTRVEKRFSTRRRRRPCYRLDSLHSRDGVECGLGPSASRRDAPRRAARVGSIDRSIDRFFFFFRSRDARWRSPSVSAESRRSSRLRLRDRSVRSFADRVR